MEEEKDILKNILNFLNLHLFSLTIAFLILVLFFGLFPIYFFKIPQSWPDFSAFATWFYAVTAFATLFVILVAAILALYQLSETSRTRKHELFSYLLDSRARTDKALTSRAALYQAYCASPEQFRYPAELPQELREHCQQIFYDFSEIGIFVDQELFEPELAKYLLHINPAKMWVILKHYAEYETEQRGYKYYMEPFQRIAKRSFLWVQNADMQDLVITNRQHETLNKTIKESQWRKELEQLERREREKNPLLKLPCCLPCCKPSHLTSVP